MDSPEDLVPPPDYEVCPSCEHLSVIGAHYLPTSPYGDRPEPEEIEGYCTCKGKGSLDYCNECFHGYHCDCCDLVEPCECRCHCACDWET